jgi:hypothetical protein
MTGLSVGEAAAIAAWALGPDCGDARGTVRGWWRHRYHGSEPCDLCRDARNAHQRQTYAAKHGPRRPLLPCGTDGAYSRHLKRGEVPCVPCLRAHAAAEARRSRCRRLVPS